MTLEDRLSNPPAKATGPGCSVCNLLADLPKGERVALQRMLDDYSWSAKNIFDAVSDEGHVIGYQTIGRHRRSDCSGLRSRKAAA